MIFSGLRPSAGKGYKQAYNEDPGSTIKLSHLDIPGKEIFSAVMARTGLLAAQSGVNLYNVSSRSSTYGVQKITPNELPIKLRFTFDTQKAIGKYIVIQDRIYKIISGLNGKENTFSFIDVVSRKFICWTYGPRTSPSLLRFTDISNCNCSNLFKDHASFILHSGFTNKDEISLATFDNEFYIVREPYNDRYYLQPFNGAFDASSSSFKLFPDLLSALINLDNFPAELSHEIYREHLKHFPVYE